jgi:hypothetical protein
MVVMAKQTMRVAGYRHVITKGAVFDDDAEVVRARPELFETPDEYAIRNRKPTNTAELGKRSMSARVERATAAPGEKRNVKRPKKDDDKS